MYMYPLRKWAVSAGHLAMWFVTEPGQRRGGDGAAEHRALPVASQAHWGLVCSTFAPVSSTAVVSCLQLLHSGQPPAPRPNLPLGVCGGDANVAWKVAGGAGERSIQRTSEGREGEAKMCWRRTQEGA